MPMECSVYGKGVQLTILRKRLRTEELSREERREIETAVAQLEKELDVE